MLIRLSVLPILLIATFLTSCNKKQYTNSKNIPFTWAESTPSKEGIDSTKLDSIHGEILSGNFGLVDHLLIVRNGKILFDKEYINDYDSIAKLYDSTYFQYNFDHPDWHPYYRKSKLHTLQSCSKSITSLLLGIAIDEGLISNVNIKVMGLFDSYNPKEGETLKDSISLKDLLTMRGGFKWDEWSTDYSNPNNSCYILEHSDNWVEYILQLPMDTVPGTKFVYNGGITVLLGEIIKSKTGMRIDKWAEEKLFKPLDINDYYWKISPNGEIDTEGGLYLSIYDFAKIGQLVMGKGMWGDERIISAKWIEESTNQFVQLNEFFGYGYQWWLLNIPPVNLQMIMANGFGGQFLFIDYENNLLTVMTGWNIHGGVEKDPVAIPIALSKWIRN